MFQIDWGGEFRNLSSCLEAYSIIYRHPCLYTHQQNGKIERKHRHIVEMGLVLLS